MKCDIDELKYMLEILSEHPISEEEIILNYDPEYRYALDEGLVLVTIIEGIKHVGLTPEGYMFLSGEEPRCCYC